jgi:hypothetical protein
MPDWRARRLRHPADHDPLHVPVHLNVFLYKRSGAMAIDFEESRHGAGQSMF